MKTHLPPPLFHQYSRGSHDFEPAEPGDARFSTRACTIKYEILKYLMDTIDERENVEKMQKEDKNMMDKIFFKTKGELNKVNKKNLCDSYGFVEREPRSGVGDHFFPVRNIGSKISIYGTNNDWNKLPVKGTSNVQYTTQVVEKDLPNGKTELAIFDLELMKIDKIIGEEDPDELLFEDFIRDMLWNIRQPNIDIQLMFGDYIDSLQNCKFRIISRTGSERTAFWAKFPTNDRISQAKDISQAKGKMKGTGIMKGIGIRKSRLLKFVSNIVVEGLRTTFNEQIVTLPTDYGETIEKSFYLEVQLHSNDDGGILNERFIELNITTIEKQIQKECIFILGRKILNGNGFESLMTLVNTNFEIYDTNIRKLIHQYTMQELEIEDNLSDIFEEKLLDGMSFATWYVCVKHTLKDPWKYTEASLVPYPKDIREGNSKLQAIISEAQHNELAFQLQVLEKIKHFIQWPISTAFKDQLRVCLYTLFGVQHNDGIMVLKKIKNSKITRPPVRWNCLPLEITIMTSLWEYYVQTRRGCMFRELAPHDVVALEELAITSEEKLIEDMKEHPAFKSIVKRQSDEL